MSDPLEQWREVFEAVPTVDGQTQLWLDGAERETTASLADIEANAAEEAARKEQGA